MPRVMVVEDQEVILANLAQILELTGLDVMQAANGLDAFNQLTAVRELPAQQPRLIISDLMMPFMDGFELLSLVRGDAVYEKLPFVLLTARSDASDLRKALALGASDYLIKPFEVDELLVMVKNQLGSDPAAPADCFSSALLSDSDFHLE
ncbi:response regulator [Limnobacter humi]|uniref:Response regulator n=1 Tax=Limnobacter humi TaxID=1778671 RepID=A0ABT1WJS3_9BURK|nr:response regulator [Limnobacter humi]MCQ8897768.1 response regulator [Limnobacter humi]